MNLLKESQSLKISADSLIHESGIVQILSNYGIVKTVGSYALDVILDNADIDFCVVSEQVSKEQALDLLNALIWQNYFDGFLFYDFVSKMKRDGFPEGYYIGLKMKSYQGCQWILDIWFLTDENDKKLTEYYKELLTEKNREVILEFKQYKKLSPYKKKILSIDIYDAVLVHNITTVDEFIEYINKKYPDTIDVTDKWARHLWL